MRITLLTFSIFLLSFIVADNPTTSQTLPTVEEVKEIKYYSEIEMEVKYLNSWVKLMYVDVLNLGNQIAIENELNDNLKVESWEDMKNSWEKIEKSNEHNTTKEDRNK